MFRFARLAWSKTPSRRPRTALSAEMLERRDTPTTVTNLNDSGAGSLRDEIANTADGGVVDFAPGLAGTIELTAELAITKNLTIRGPGADAITISGGNASRIFLVDDGSGTAVDVAISGLTLTEGNSTAGGAISTRENLTVTNAILTGNSSVGRGGAIEQSYNSSLTIENTTLSGNTAGGAGGAVSFYASGNVAIRNSTISGNTSGLNGGGILLEEGTTATLENLVVTGNIANSKGGGLFFDDIDVVVRNSVISGNRAAQGGGVYFYADNPASLLNTTVTNNSATSQGGGVFARFNAPVVIRNSTISGNRAGIDGGGIFTGASSFTLTNSTVVNNVADSDNNLTGAGGGLFVNAGTATIVSTILAGNAVGTTSPVANDATGTLAAAGANNLVGVDTGLTGITNGTNSNQIGTAASPIDPLIGPLQNNGGFVAGVPGNTSPILTHALLTGSPARDAGSNPASLTNDERGAPFVRNFNVQTDIGAFEAQPFATTTAVAVSPTSTLRGEPVTFTATVASSTSGVNVPTGVVDFFDGPTLIGSAPLVNGVASFTISSLQVGTHSITAAFLGGEDFAASTSPDAASVNVTQVLRPNQNEQPLYSTSGSTSSSLIEVRQSDGSVLSTTNPVGGDSGSRSAVADVNGDGVPDTIVASGPGSSTQVFVVDGATGTFQQSFMPFESQFTGGAFVAAGDVDGDGLADIAVSADTTGGPRVIVYSGADGSVLADFFGIDDANFRGGARVAMGDVDGDGLSDLVVAAGTGGGPRVAVFDGASLRPGLTPTRLVDDFFAFESTLRDGVYVAVGDVNDDGRGDLIFGGGPTGGPRVLIWDSATLLASGPEAVRTLADFFAADSSLRFGGVRVVAKDLDGDSLADLVVGVSTSETASVVKTYLGSVLATQSNPTSDTEVDPGVAGVFVG